MDREKEGWERGHPALGEGGMPSLPVKKEGWERGHPALGEGGMPSLPVDAFVPICCP